ncbi:hypothetical protein L3Q82_019496, partial [Scortum barcoo]
MPAPTLDPHQFAYRSNRSTEDALHCVLSHLENKNTYECKNAGRGRALSRTWCADNNLLLNTSKTKELIVDFRKVKRETHDPIHINGMAVEHVSSFKFLRDPHLREPVPRTANTSSLIKKAHQRLFFLRTLKKNHLSTAILGNFYQVCDREYPNQLHHSLVWELLCRGPQGTAEGGENTDPPAPLH